MRVPVVCFRLKEGVNDETGAGQQQARHNEQQPAPLARVQALPPVALPALSHALNTCTSIYLYCVHV